MQRQGVVQKSDYCVVWLCVSQGTSSGDVKLIFLCRMLLYWWSAFIHIYMNVVSSYFSCVIFQCWSDSLDHLIFLRLGYVHRPNGRQVIACLSCLHILLTRGHTDSGGASTLFGCLGTQSRNFARANVTTKLCTFSICFCATKSCDEFTVWLAFIWYMGSVGSIITLTDSVHSFWHSPHCLVQLVPVFTSLDFIVVGVSQSAFQRRPE